MTGTQLPRTTAAAMTATVTVRDLLAVPPLGLRLLSAPGRIDVPVRWAHPTELLDPRPYLAGQELVLTVGTSLQADGERCRRFVEYLADAEVSALGYGVGDVTEEVPAALVEACRSHELPLLQVPEGVPFQAITELLADRRAEAVAAGERRVQRLSTRLLDALAEDSPLERLLDIVAADLGGHVELTDGRLVWTALSDADVEPSESTLRHLESVLAVRQHEQDLASAQLRAESGRLLRLVIERKADPEVLRDVVTAQGLRFDQPLVVAAWPDKAAGLVTAALAPVLLADLANESVSISADPKRVLAAASAAAVPCGLAEPCRAADLAAAVQVAEAALELSRRRGGPATARDLVSFEGLLEQQPRERILPFADTLLLPLLEQDRTHGTALVATLRAFLECDGSVNATAQALHLHPNSLRHRLKRIGELAGADPKSFSDRVALAIALWAWDRRPRGRH